MIDPEKDKEEINRAISQASTEELREIVKEWNERPEVQEMNLAMTQPLLDWGWRIDYEQKGLVRPDQFISLGTMKRIVEALYWASPIEGEPKEPAAEKYEPEPGESFIPLDPLWEAVNCLDPDWEPGH